MKMLICSDGSELSHAVLEPAARLAQAAQAEVHLVRVVDLSHVHERARGSVTPSRRRTADLSGGNLPGAGGGLANPKYRYERSMVEDRDRAVTRAEAEAKDALDALAATLPVRPLVAVLHGADAAEAITDYATEHAIDVIAMASHSRSRVGQMVFGSTTNAVIRRKVAPVLVVSP